jgi:flagella basal body P-ring formation protein FlgA
MKSVQAALGVALFAWPWLCKAGESPDAVAASVRQSAAALAPPGASITLGPVSGAQYMQPCKSSLAVTMSGDAPYEQAAAHCAAPVWTLYVSVTVAQSEAVVVASRPIAAGQTLSAADLQLASLPVQQFAGRQIFFDPVQLVGATADMSVAAGVPLTADDVQEPVMVKAGQTESVQVISGGVLLSLDATADETGRLGDTILFTNPGSGRRFTAEITANGPEVKLQ